jgi:hypothetical protein
VSSFLGSIYARGAGEGPPIDNPALRPGEGTLPVGILHLANSIMSAARERANYERKLQDEQVLRQRSALEVQKLQREVNQPTYARHGVSGLTPQEAITADRYDKQLEETRRYHDQVAARVGKASSKVVAAKGVLSAIDAQYKPGGRYHTMAINRATMLANQYRAQLGSQDQNIQSHARAALGLPNSYDHAEAMRNPVGKNAQLLNKAYTDWIGNNASAWLGDQRAVDQRNQAGRAQQVIASGAGLDEAATAAAPGPGGADEDAALQKIIGSFASGGGGGAGSDEP